MVEHGAGILEGVSVRKRAQHGRSRTGCKSCRAARIKCDESRPVCARCTRHSVWCEYPAPTAATGIVDGASRARPLLSAGNVTVVLPLWTQPSSCHLQGAEVSYYDFFRKEFASLLQAPPDCPANFWVGTVLRDSMRDTCILRIVLAIGAFAHARYYGGAAAETVQLSQFVGNTYDTKYLDSYKYYTMALAEYRQRLSQAGTGVVKSSWRTILIATILLPLFERLQGNAQATDKLTAYGITLLQDVLGRALVEGRQSLIAAPLDDEGVNEGEWFLLRTAAWGSLFTPQYPHVTQVMVSHEWSCSDAPWPPLSKCSLDEYSKIWWRFLTIVVMWYVRFRQALISGHVEAFMNNPDHDEERQTFVAQTKAWSRTSRARLRVATNPSTRRLLRLANLCAMVVHIAAKCCFDLAGSQHDLYKDECVRVIEYARPVVEEEAASLSHHSFYCDGLLACLIQMARFCRIAEVRTAAVKLCKRLIGPRFSWDIKGFVMGNLAIVQMEEAERDAAGVVAQSKRYEWVHSSWNDAHTVLAVRLVENTASIHSRYKEVELLLRPEDFGF